MAKMPFFMFYPHDWLYDTRVLNDEEKAVLIDLLCFMWNAPKRGILSGHPQDLAPLANKEWPEFRVIIDSLKRKQILDVTFCNDEVTLKSRRMVRDENTRESNRLRKRKFDERNRNGGVTDNKSEANKSEVINYKDKRFEKPTAIDVSAYAKTIAFNLDGQTFIDHYEGNGWVVGRSPMKNWKAVVRTWKTRSYENGHKRNDASGVGKIGDADKQDSKFSGITRTVKTED